MAGIARRPRIVPAKPGQGQWRGKVDIFTGAVQAGPTTVEAAAGAAGKRAPGRDGTLGNYRIRKSGALGAGRGGIGQGTGMFGGAGSRFR